MSLLDEWRERQAQIAAEAEQYEESLRRQREARRAAQVVRQERQAARLEEILHDIRRERMGGGTINADGTISDPTPDPGTGEL